MKKALSGMLAMLMLITSLAACGSPKNESAVNGGGGGAGEASVILNIAMHVANVKDQEPAMYEAIEAFQAKHPEIMVNLSGADTNDHIKKMKVQAQSGEMPDIFWMLPASAKEMNQAGLLLDLSEMINDTPELSAIDPMMLKNYEDSGKKFGLPYQSLVTGLWYNKALFEEYNVKVPETYEELIEAVNVFKANNVVTIAQGAKDNYSIWAFLGMLTRYGYFDKIDAILAGEEKFNNPDFLRLFNQIAELQELGAFPENVTTMSYFQAVEMFTSGKAAMLDAGAWETGKLEASPIAETVGFSWGPTFSDGVGNQKIAMISASAPLVASAKVKEDSLKYDAVQKFFTFYYSQEGMQIMVDNQLPPITNYEADVDKNSHPVYAELIRAMNEPEWEKPIAQPDLVVSDAIGNAMYDSIYGVINGFYSPEQALDLIDQKIEQQ
ncbi:MULTISPECIES: ABC transporter substrate-binding protein [Paenibacillus]|uniref:ABC transporter substrate-binding protein n=1 Tax=Paenibacillus lautus TaxID=1401 RepID=A0A1R1AU34_PAELA|nr:extracellular solute-binding protein [Paenibacillus lautus]OME89085.1 hypothetical protein BK123_27295 [Paenibacillus lautus]